jgi:acetoacetate decarboxylase
MYYRNGRWAIFHYETDGEQAARLLPSSLELTDPPTALLVLIEYPWTSIGPYNEALQFLVCTHRGRLVQYVPNIFVTNDAAMAAGREIWGYPKKIGHIDFVRENEILAGYVERPRGFRICAGLMRVERPMALSALDPSSAPLLPTVCLRMIPAAESPQLAELIEVGVEVRIQELWAASGSCHYTGISEIDPWHKVPVRRMLQCAYATGDCELTAGRILETI